MKYIKNEFINGLGLDFADDFEGAKIFFVMQAKALLAEPDFVADSTEEELDELREYATELHAATSMEELCEILNRETDTCGNGTHYEVWEV